MTEEPAKRWVQATGMPFCVEPGGEPVEPVGPVHVVLDVFLAGPHDLHRAVDLLRDLHRANDAVDFQPPAEAAADQVIVDAPPSRAAVRQLCGRRPARARSPGCRPRFRSRPGGHEPCSSSAPCVGVREERNLVDRVDLAWRRRPCACSASPMFCATAPGPRVACSSSAAIAAVVSFACGPSSHSIDERGEPFLRGAHVVGDDRDGVVEPHDLAHALDGLRRRVVHALQRGRRTPATARASRSSRRAAARRCRRPRCR